MSNTSNLARLASLAKRALRRLTGATPPAAAAKVPQAPLPFAPKFITRFAPAMPTLPLAAGSRRPMISFVVIVYKMPEQARKTLLSLSTDYQRGVEAGDYEIIVVENRSKELLGEAAATACSGNVRYFLRDETMPTPVFAIEFGAAQARGTHIAVVIDGARMCSPGVVNAMLSAASLFPAPVIAVPGYHLGPELQQISTRKGYNEEVEAGLLESIQWPRDGYRLFEIACLSGTCSSGIFKPIGESNCIAVSRAVYDKLGGFDINFTETGGGQVNLDFYKRAVELEETQLVILPGEGSFHQIHGGVTTSLEGSERQESMRAHFAQYGELRGASYSPPDKRAIYLGAIPDAALKFVQHGAAAVTALDAPGRSPR